MAHPRPARHVLLLLAAGVAVVPYAAPVPPPSVHLTDVSAASGITAENYTGRPDRKDYIFEVKGGGVGALDYDGDGWVDLLFSRGSSMERWRRGDNPGPVLYRNRRDGTFEDVTRAAGLTRGGWGIGVSVADYDNDGWVDVYLTNLGADVLYRNNGNGTFTDVTGKAGIRAEGWSSSAAFGDFDGDGHLDLYVAAYLDVGPDALPVGPAGGTCTYVGVPVLCGPRGLPGARDLYFHNNGDGTFTEQSEVSGASDEKRYFGLGVVTADVDGDRDLDLYVGNDATPNYLFVNRGNGRFDERGFESGTAVSGDGNEQASMGVDAADFDNDGRLDLYATHFANDYSTLYRNLGELLFEDITARAHLRAPAWPFVKWGTAFLDLDQDGWKDLVHANGHVYPHLRDAPGKETYEQPALSVYVNDRDGTFRDASGEVGPDAGKRVIGRGLAFADLDNDGDLDLVVACLDSKPLMLRNDQAPGRWLMLRAVGSKANRDAIGTRITARTGERSQVWEVKRTVGIYSASDPRAHFGLGDAAKADLVRVEWPGGKVDEFRDVPAGRHYLVDEAKGLSLEPLRGR
ncbi:FG-GAP repeat [Luteitalea pratensis]|uniref:FG-GAP repeat n=1 Tax=Luteitalea pratensis TaxID=1855912 RepID=A0A143PJE7_LUTPR|nr:CRTAC1 family protein [Luteitalea pratensis]AMY08687.1 FG-GAP repeat [Luteitalea pratensis]